MSQRSYGSESVFIFVAETKVSELYIYTANSKIIEIILSKALKHRHNYDVSN